MTDHLGNNRVVANASGSAVQKNHYYPFGMPFAETLATEQGKQPYKFGDKELDQMHGLNHYDFSARYMDGIRFTTIDPMAEKYYSWSPYVYCGNNPIRITDPTGMYWLSAEDEKIADRLKQSATERISSLWKDEYNINISINEIKNNTNLSEEKKLEEIGKLEEKLEDVLLQKGALNSLVEGIDAIRDSTETAYTYNTVDSNKELALLGSEANGTVIINNYGDMGNRAHETFHAIQYNNGNFKFSPLGTTNVIFNKFAGANTASEITSYIVEYAITKGRIVSSSTGGTPNSSKKINRTWLTGIKQNGVYVYPSSSYH